MGGISVLLLFGLMWPVVICYALLPWLLSWLGVAITVAAGVLLAANGVFLAALLLARRWLKGKGYLDAAYRESLGDWRGTALWVGNILLPWLPSGRPWW